MPKKIRNNDIHSQQFCPKRERQKAVLFGRGCASVEQFTIKCDIIVKFESFQVSLENRVVRAMLLG
jgi:hypothetical protein